MKLFSILGIATLILTCGGASAQVVSRETALKQIAATKESAEAKRAVRQIGGTCQDVERLRSMEIAAVSQEAKDVYADAATERVNTALRFATEANAKLPAYNKALWWKMGDQDDGTHSDAPTADEAISTAKTRLESAKCYLSPEKLPTIKKLISGLEALRAHFAEYRAVEIKCRKSAPCKAKRLAMRNAQELCSLYDQRKVFEQIVAEEKGNPAGVVDLVRLHDAGAGIQQTDTEIKEAKVAFKAKTNTNFDRTICKELPADSETSDDTKAPETVTLDEQRLNQALGRAHRQRVRSLFQIRETTTLARFPP